jgi:energy-coupling factor transporter ATP-binding protein EcfA2
MTDIELTRMNIPRRFWDANWAIMDVQWQELVQKYITEAFAERTGKGLLLYGPGGCGKSYIAAVIAKILRTKEFHPYFISSENMNEGEIYGRFDDQKTIMDRCRTTDLLVIDDFGPGTKTDILYSILKTRRDNLLSTIMTMRVTPSVDEVKDAKKIGAPIKWNIDDHFETCYHELMPVIFGSLLPVVVDGMDYRERELIDYRRQMFPEKGKKK